MQVYKAILFDVDGTLLDTTEFIFQAFEYTLSKYGYPAKSRDLFAGLVGKPLDYNYSVLAPDSDIGLLSKTHREFQLDHVGLAKTYPGTKKTLETIYNDDLRMAAVTTRARASTIETLKSCDILDYFDYVVALEDVVKAKPDPEPVFKALRYLGIQPRHALMAGDSDADIYAGKNAGTKTAGATYGFHGMKIAESNPDYLIDSIGEILPLIIPTPDPEDRPLLIK
jgi:pyrophosphatase PpaX